MYSWPCVWKSTSAAKCKYCIAGATSFTVIKTHLRPVLEKKGETQYMDKHKDTVEFTEFAHVLATSPALCDEAPSSYRGKDMLK